MENEATITHNSDFLFLYEAIQCNPNGDIDQENKPRMDYDNQINLVTDVRIKRYIRDFLKTLGKDIFVDMEGENKVSPSTRLENIVKRVLADEVEYEKILVDRPDLKAKLFEVKQKLGGDFNKIFNFLVTGKMPGEKKEEKDKDEKSGKKEKKWNEEFNFHVLAYLVKQKFIDIRFFGSAFAIGGFTKSYIGPIQLNWGYSLHKVQLMESNSIVTIMNDNSSTIGKDYRVHYSLLAFAGTVNKYAAISTGLTEADLGEFRKAIWESIPAMPTRSKMNQYPKLYVEVVYNNGYNNGHFGDLRQYVSVTPTNGLDEKQMRKFDDLTLDLSKLKNALKGKVGDGQPVKEVKISNGYGVQFSL
jgi:CRISPR-associated protein Csh2